MPSSSPPYRLSPVNAMISVVKVAFRPRKRHLYVFFLPIMVGGVPCGALSPFVPSPYPLPSVANRRLAPLMEVGDTLRLATGDMG